MERNKALPVLRHAEDATHVVRAGGGASVKVAVAAFYERAVDAEAVEIVGEFMEHGEFHPARRHAEDPALVGRPALVGGPVEIAVAREKEPVAGFVEARRVEAVHEVVAPSSVLGGHEEDAGVVGIPAGAGATVEHRRIGTLDHAAAARALAEGRHGSAIERVDQAVVRAIEIDAVDAAESVTSRAGDSVELAVGGLDWGALGRPAGGGSEGPLSLEIGPVQIDAEEGTLAVRTSPEGDSVELVVCRLHHPAQRIKSTRCSGEAVMECVVPRSRIETEDRAEAVRPSIARRAEEEAP